METNTSASKYIWSIIVHITKGMFALLILIFTYKNIKDPTLVSVVYLFLGFEICHKIHFHYEKRLFNTWGLSVFVKNSRLEKKPATILFIILGLLNIAGYFISIYIIGLNEKTSTTIINIVCGLFLLEFISKKIGSWIAEMTYSISPEKYPNYQSFYVG